MTRRMIKHCLSPAHEDTCLCFLGRFKRSFLRQILKTASSTVFSHCKVSICFQHFQEKSVDDAYSSSVVIGRMPTFSKILRAHDQLVAFHSFLPTINITGHLKPPQRHPPPQSVQRLGSASRGGHACLRLPRRARRL